MDYIYVVIAEEGEPYSGSWERNIVAFTSLKEAQAYVNKLNKALDVTLGAFEEGEKAFEALKVLDSEIVPHYIPEYNYHELELR